MEHRGQIRVECPQCHARQFLEIHLDEPLADSQFAREIQAHLQAWIATRCPDHLGPYLKVTKN